MTRPRPGIFKAYDVRGLYPAPAHTARSPAASAARSSSTWARSGSRSGATCARPPRRSRPGFIRGARSQGCEVIDIGVVGTDMMYFFVGEPRPRRRRHHHRLAQPEGVERRQDGAQGRAGPLGRRRHQGDPRGAAWPAASPTIRATWARPRAPQVVDRRTTPATACRSSTSPGCPKLKVVLDTGNGMGAVGAAAILPRLPLELVKMYFDLDGTFPNHPPDPLEEANRREIMARVKPEKADLGIAWDGDADRCFFIDDTGAFVPGDFVTALLGEQFCRKEPGARIVYDVRASRAVRRPRAARPAATALMHRVGHAFIKKRMRDENAAFGGEVSGHFYFRDNWYADNGMIPARAGAGDAGRDAASASASCWRRCASATTSRARSTRRSPTSRRPWRASRRSTADARITKLDGVSDRLRRLALQRAPVQHGAAAAPEPRGLHGRGDGAPPRRGPRRHPRLKSAGRA